MHNQKKIIVWDLETSSVDPNTCDVFQIAALAVDPIKLQIIPNSTFNVWVKPDDVEKEGYYEQYKSTIDWHAKNFHCTAEVFLDKIKNATPEKLAWEQFTQYLSQYHDRQNNQNFHSSPIPAGYNIINFDMKIVERLARKYKCTQKDGSQNIFYARDIRDILHIVSLWLSPLDEVKSYSMDNIRDYFGLTRDGGHEAMKDVEDEAKLLLKFLGLHNQLAQKISFKNVFATA